jgi:hypothetical protein
MTMPRFVVLVVGGADYEERELLELARLMSYPEGLQLDRRTQSADLFRDLTPFRRRLEEVLGEADVRALAIVFPPKLADDYDLSSLTSGVSFTWSVSPPPGFETISSMSSLHEGLIVYGFSKPRC